MEAFAFNTIEIILLSAVGLFFFIQLFYYLFIYRRIHAHNKAVAKGDIDFLEELPPVSIIIRACNESEHLRENLESVLQQDYPTFEVIVINDGSTDESEELLKSLETKYSNLYHSFTPEAIRNISNKKLAITLGIKASKYDILLFTEANCRPASNQWLRLMARNFTPTTEVVLGYSSYTYRKRRTNRLACFDNLFRSMRFLGMALNDKPYMGIGRNLAYRKHVFYDNKGFSHYLELYRGEDDLFVNEVSNSLNTRVETSADAVVRVFSEDFTYMDWKQSCIDYIITSRFYKGGQRTALGFETLTRYLFFLTVAATMAIGIIDFHWLVAGSAFLLWLIRLIVQFTIINRTADELGEKRRYYLSLFWYDIVFPMRYFFFGFSKQTHKQNYCVNISSSIHNAWS